MPPTSLSTRLQQALDHAGLHQAALAKKVGTTEATISNWLKDKVQVDHVKAAMLLKICAVLNVRPEWLLLGETRYGTSYAIAESAAGYGPSQSVKQETLTIALQLASEALEEKKRSLPPTKRSELVATLYDLLEEGLPEAKVLRFARTAVA
jgi:transcriptional regulator with XRE-family HTH domain